MLLLQLNLIFHIPAHASLALNVSVTVALVVYAAPLLIDIVHALGAVLSSFTHVVISSEIFPALSIALNLSSRFLSAVYVIVHTPFVVVNALVVQAQFSYHSRCFIPEILSIPLNVITTSFFVHAQLLEFVKDMFVGFVLSNLYVQLAILLFHALSYAHTYKYLVHSVLSVIVVQLVYCVQFAQHCANVVVVTVVQ